MSSSVGIDCWRLGFCGKSDKSHSSKPFQHKYVCVWILLSFCKYWWIVLWN